MGLFVRSYRKRESNIRILEDKIEEAKSTLNDEQKEVFDQILNFLVPPKEDVEEEKDIEDVLDEVPALPTAPKKKPTEYFTLIGYAGVGKTYIVSKISSVIDCNIAMTAPTNKAVKVLMDNRGRMENNRITYATIHKLLALKVQWDFPTDNDSNAVPTQKLVKNPYTDPTINEYDLIIIDECSMLDDEIFQMLHDEKYRHIKVLFMGDPAQIPPVNRMDAIPLLEDQRAKYNIDVAYLKQIMRQANGSNILNIATQIRNKRFQDGDPIASRISEGDVQFYNSQVLSDRQLFGKSMLDHFESDKFKTDANYCKCIAYTNRMVDSLNEVVRKRIFKNLIEDGKPLPPLVVGEKVIADKPIMADGCSVFNTSDEFEILEMTEKSYYYTLPKATKSVQLDFGDDFKETGKSYDYEIKYYECKVKYFDVFSQEFYEDKYVNILTEFGTNPYKWALGRLKKLKAWKEYYKLYEEFAQVKYNYAITAHKSQGSTYQNVFLIEDDMDLNSRTLERNRIKYTACTRPKSMLHILSKRNKPRG